MHLLLHGPAGGRAQAIRMDHDALAIRGDDQHPRSTTIGMASSLVVKGIKVLTQVHGHLFALTLRRLPTPERSRCATDSSNEP
jgi:hypothetical protein